MQDTTYCIMNIHIRTDIDSAYHVVKPEDSICHISGQTKMSIKYSTNCDRRGTL